MVTPASFDVGHLKKYARKNRKQVFVSLEGID